MGVSCFVCYSWCKGQRPRWTFLIGRVIEKTSKCYCAAILKVHELCNLADATSLHEWSDGPRQMKSTLALGMTLQHLQRHHNLKRATRHYGGSKHAKGVWDGMIGLMRRVTDQAAKKTPMRTVAEYIAPLQTWAEREQKRFPSGPVYQFLEWMPELKQSYNWLKLKANTLQGIETSHCFEFERNDKRKAAKLLGRDTNYNKFVGVNFRNRVLSGQQPRMLIKDTPFIEKDDSDKDSDHDDEPGPDSEHLDLKHINGWRCSYVKEGAHSYPKRLKRRAHLTRMRDANAQRHEAMAEAQRFRTVVDRRARALAVRARTFLRAATIRGKVPPTTMEAHKVPARSSAASSSKS